MLISAKGLVLHFYFLKGLRFDLILPQGRAAQAESISFESASLVSTQVFAIFATDGEASTLQELQSELLRGLAIRTHQPGTVHIPEPPVDACTGEKVMQKEKVEAQ